MNANERANQQTNIRLHASLAVCAVHAAFITLVSLCSVPIAMCAAE
jgi:hypothetical protein